MKTYNYNTILYSLIFLIVFSSCEKDEENLFDKKLETAQPINLELKYFLGSPIKVKKEDDGTYSIGGGDIRLFDDQLSDSPSDFDSDPIPGQNNQKLALSSYINKWPNNTVIYKLNGLSQSVRQEVQASLQEWSSKTNITFKERTTESNYVTIRSSGESCNCGVATLGMYGNSGYIELGTQATALVIIHEIGHTLGYIHEQNRADRDNYIQINYENIQAGAQDQFDIIDNAVFLTSSFDINSTMMYGSYTFSKNGKPTILDIHGNLLPYSQAALSDLDIAGTNNAYPTTNDETENSKNPCLGVQAWGYQKYYDLGERIIYEGDLYERDYSGWNFLRTCQ